MRRIDSRQAGRRIGIVLIKEQAIELAGWLGGIIDWRWPNRHAPVSSVEWDPALSRAEFNLKGFRRYVQLSSI